MTEDGKSCSNEDDDISSDNIRTEQLTVGKQEGNTDFGVPPLVDE